MVMTVNAKTWAPLATFVAVAAIGTTYAFVSSGDDGGKGLRPLGLQSATTAVGAASDEAKLAPGAPGSGGYGGGYKVTGDLPQGEPADAAVWALSKGPADKALVTRLAAALDAGTPVREGSGWRAGGLYVSDEAGQSWYWSPCSTDGGKDVAVSSDGSTRSACAIAVAPVPGSGSGSGSSGSAGTGTIAPDASPVPQDVQPQPMPAVSEDVVKDGAREVLDALGYDVDKADIDTQPYGGSAAVDPVVDGLQVAYFTTRVDVDATRKVTSANGFLGTPDRGDAYPLMSAEDALGDMPAMGRPDICLQPKDGSTGCAEPEPIEITGATLGLSLQQTRDGLALVPSWLYAVKGTDYPIVAVAVEEQYQSAPDDKPVDLPASTEPDPGTEPGQVDPAPPTASRWPVMIQSAKAGAGNTLVVTYDNGGCGEKNVTGSVKEDEKAVYVALEADARPADQSCTADYRAATITLDLQSALGDRKVVNANATAVDVPRG